jgi:oxygen-independent coproporphyrinogen III oxidase
MPAPRTGPPFPLTMPDATPALYPSFGAEAYAAALARSNADGGALAAYVHLPFCRQRCRHCACPGVIVGEAPPTEAYLSRLDREMVLVARHLAPGRGIRQLHWGGGTPALLTLNQMGDLIDRLDARFGLSTDRDRDFLIEVDPREADPLMLRHLQALGFNRLTLGVQDLAPPVQQAIHRQLSRGLTEQLIDEANRLGFRALTIDLMVGLPHQTRAGFAATLEQVIAMAPPRLTLYPYAHRPARHAAQRGLEPRLLPDAATRRAILADSHHRLSEAGMLALDDIRFVRAGDVPAPSPRDRIGLGMAATSRVDDLLVGNPPGLRDYAAALDDGRLATIGGRRLRPSADRLPP